MSFYNGLCDQLCFIWGERPETLCEWQGTRADREGDDMVFGITTGTNAIVRAEFVSRPVGAPRTNGM